MPVSIVVGIQWGDEGKGKVVDYLTERAELVVRFQGGNNAGHTVVIEGRKTALQLIPSGILREGTRCLLASGVVLNPFSIITELEKLKEIDIAVTPERLGIAGEVQLILPYHQAIDAAREQAVNRQEIGTTKKGIGPAYEDSVSRIGIRFIDLLNEKVLKEKIERNVELKNHYLKSILGVEEQFDAAKLFEDIKPVAERLKPYLANVSVEVNKAIDKKDYVMFEGAQGCLLDISHGTYPYVTSSNTVAGYACASAGFGPKNVNIILGICKAYCTRVGGGPFPTEDAGEAGQILRDAGGEYGTVTNRPRRCGWFDSMAVKKAIRLNGVDTLILTKLDVLSGFEKIRIGTTYRLGDKVLEDLPVSADDIEKVEVEYEELPGWKEDVTGVRELEALPVEARNFISRIEELVGCKVGGFSVGPDREQTVISSKEVRNFVG